MYRVLALSGLFALTALPALAQSPPPELKVETANVTRVVGNRVELGLGLFKRGERGRHPVEVWFVNGAQRDRLWSGDSVFSGTQGGFRSSVSVNLAGRDLRRGKLEVVLPACTGRACKRNLPLNGGANLQFAGVDEIQRQGSVSFLRLQVTNTGTVASTPCKLQVDINDRRANTFPVPAIAPNAQKDFRVQYNNNQQGGRYVARLVCRDMLRFDNDRDGTLR